MMMFMIVMMVMTQMKVMMRITSPATAMYPRQTIFLVISMMVNLIMTLMMMVVISPSNSHMTNDQ